VQGKQDHAAARAPEGAPLNYDRHVPPMEGPKPSRRSPDAYTAALTLVGQQATLVWTVSAAFFLPQTALLGFLLTRDLNDDRDLAVCAGSVIGLVLTILWLAALLRTGTMYKVRMAQAREVEPEGWNFLRRGRKIAKGSVEEIDGDEYRIPWLGRNLPVRKASSVLVGVFFLAYASLFVLSGSWRTSSAGEERKLARIYALESACFTTPTTCELHRIAPNLWKVKGVGGNCYVIDLTRFKVGNAGSRDVFDGIGKVPCSTL
jgi:hypothetical protein